MRKCRWHETPGVMCEVTMPYQQLFRHMQTHEQEGKGLRCGTCELGFPDLYALSYHMEAECSGRDQV